MHLYFEMPDVELPSGVGKLGPESMCAQRGICPRTALQTQLRQHLHVDQCPMTKPIKPAEWLVRLISAQTKPKSHEAKGAGAEFLGTGHRNADLTSAAGFFVRRHDVSAAQLEAMLHKLNEVATSPLAPSEVAAIARSVHGYAGEPVQNLDETHLSSDLATYLNRDFGR